MANDLTEVDKNFEPGPSVPETPIDCIISANACPESFFDVAKSGILILKSDTVTLRNSFGFAFEICV